MTTNPNSQHQATASPLTLAFVEHSSDAGAGPLLRHLQAGNLDVTNVVAHDEEQWANRPDLSAVDALVILGGPMSATDAKPWYDDLAAAVRNRVETQRFTLGICLGHQFIAHTLGGVVGAHPAGHQIGPQPFAPRAGTWLAAHSSVLHWNSEVVLQLPDGAVPLAWDSSGEVDAAQYGPTTFGIQGHPEGDIGTMRRWAADEDDVARLSRDGIDVGKNLQLAERRATDLDIATCSFAATLTAAVYKHASAY